MKEIISLSPIIIIMQLKTYIAIECGSPFKIMENYDLVLNAMFSFLNLS